MNLSNSNIKWFSSFFAILLAVLILSACKKDKVGGTPQITSIRNYSAAPGDTLVTSITAGQWIVIHGSNLKDAVEILFDGVPAQFNYGLFSNDMAVVQIPATIPFNTVPAELLNTVRYTTVTGSTLFSFNYSYPMPVITGIGNETFFPGDSVYIQGSGFFLVQSVNFAGGVIKNFAVDSLGTFIRFICPPLAEVPGGPIKVVAQAGTAITSKIYTVGKPSIISISNENPSAGDSVYIYGAAFKDVQTVNFGGVTIATYNTSPDFSYIAFKCPPLNSSGVVTVTTSYGSASTTFKVNDVLTGMIGNMEWGDLFGWQWWGGASLQSGDPNSGWPPYDPLFAGNPSMFMSLINSPLNSGDGNNGSTAIRLGDAQWMPAGNISDAPENWAVKFEMNVPKAWNGASLCIQGGVSNNIMYRYEPWSTATGAEDFKTKGWVTVTIPLSSFRTNSATLGDGRGNAITTLTSLVGNSGKTGMNLYMHNYSAATNPTGYYAAFDNIRVVKIK
ncbi:glycan-binding surface protein [Pinibacter aurantiacus]|uniref:Surface glycan-binding protein B xyloglucan binding domain-containing protein n=1 Tax=Pinibacter aurantiacus TaxID=2851599 RepID=A0A9E2SEQ8_9BACT|nr:glycan-binding surface protein [Pinibacter aurantiacus]MBV4358735.1 hypothetical protein [Pinibacter aurantiacus]